MLRIVRAKETMVNVGGKYVIWPDLFGTEQFVLLPFSVMPLVLQ
jgi:hypothetical protein